MYLHVLKIQNLFMKMKDFIAKIAHKQIVQSNL